MELGPGGAPAAALERDRRALPLPLLRRVTATILAAPFASDDALLGALRRPVPHGRADASLFRMAISAASAGGRVPRRRRRTGGCRRTRSRCCGATPSPPRTTASASA